jgi:poly-gamma-glutamate synthesis protein (capsule biosynthesis protein)
MTSTKTGEMTTHIIGGYARGRVTPQPDVVTFMIGGDVMFARGVAESVKQTKQQPFETIGERFFWGVDIAMINLEGVFTSAGDIADGWQAFPPKLRFNDSFVPLLSYLRVRAVSLANNHSADGGIEDVNYTTSLLKQQGIDTVGDATNNPATRLARYQNGDLEVSMITVATQAGFTGITEQIQQQKAKGDRVVVFAHWGTEYDVVHNQLQEDMAHSWIDAGADLIIGSHPHVVQDAAVYRGVPIVYSLGNFLFDQGEQPETKVGAVVAGMFATDGLSLTLIPVQSYLRPAVFDSGTHYDLSMRWTEPWLSYRQPDDNFFFPYAGTATTK